MAGALSWCHQELVPQQQAGNARESAGQRQRQDHVAADRDADGACHVPVGGDGAHAPTRLGALQQEPDGSNKHGTQHDDGERLAAEHEACDVERAAADERRRSARRAVHGDGERLFDDGGERDGGDERRFGRSARQRQDGNARRENADDADRQRHYGQQQHGRQACR